MRDEIVGLTMEAMIGGNVHVVRGVHYNIIDVNMHDADGMMLCININIPIEF